MKVPGVFLERSIRLITCTNPTINASTRLAEVIPVRHFYDSKYAIAVSGFLDNGQHIDAASIYRYGTPLLLIQELQVDSLETGDVGFEVKHFWQFQPCVDVEDKTLTEDFLEKNENE